MVVQTSYPETPARGFQGMLAETFSKAQKDSYVGEGALEFGQAVVRGTDPEKQVKTIVGEVDISGFMGITLAVLQDIETAGSTRASYADKQMVSVIDDGRIYVTASAAVAVGAEVVPNIADTKFAPGTGTSKHKCYARSAAAADGDVFIVEVVGPQG